MTPAGIMSASDMGERLRVANDNWGATSLAAVHAVLGSVYDVLTDAFGASPDAPVNVARWDQDPRALYDKRPYDIRLNARDRYWCQYVYQFAHELCHVMTGFDRYREHRHKWFEETLCELASLFVLHRLATVWDEAPPREVTGARGFAPNHESYAENLQIGYGAVLDIDLPEWLAGSIESLEADPCRRDLNGVAAVSLLGRFRENPSLWRDCGYLNRWDPRVDVTFADYLDSWGACLPRKGRTGRVPVIVKEKFQLHSAGSSTLAKPASRTRSR